MVPVAREVNRREHCTTQHCGSSVIPESGIRKIPAQLLNVEEVNDAGNVPVAIHEYIASMKIGELKGKWPFVKVSSK